MRLKVSVEELIDNDCLTKYAENRQTQVTELGLEKEDEVYISEAEAEEMAERRLEELVEEYGRETISESFDAVKNVSEEIPTADLDEELPVTDGSPEELKKSLRQLARILSKASQRAERLSHKVNG